LVDDDKSVRESLGRVFDKEGWQTVVAANGEEALEHLASRLPDLMITDLGMDGINGWDLLIHEGLQRPEMPVFVITGLGRDSIEGADLLATEFFPKPLDLEALVGAVRRRLGND